MSRKPPKRKPPQPAKPKAKKAQQLSLSDALFRAVQLHGSGQLLQAEELYRQVLKSVPGQVDALHCLGLIAFQRQRFGQAENLILQAIGREPNVPEFHCNLGQVYRNQGKLDEAMGCYRKAIELKPDYAEALSHLGGALYELGDVQGAVEHGRRAVEAGPSYAEGHSNLGIALAARGRFESAITHFKRAILLNPSLAEAHHNLGNSLFQLGRVKEARQSYEYALQLRPDDGLRIKMATLLPPIYESEAEIGRYRRKLEAQLNEIAEQMLQIPNPAVQSGMANFYLVYQGQEDRAIQEKLARIYRSAMNPEAPSLAPRSAGKKIGIGFVSRFFHQHTIGKLYRGLIANLDRKRFSTTVFAIEPRQDSIADFVRLSVDRYIPLPNRLDAARQAIADAGLDVLFYTDIGMHPLTYFLAFYRLAPVQCVTWGHPVTTGIETIDYFIASDGMESEGGESRYSEKLIRLNASPAYFYRPELPSPLKDRAGFKFSDDWTLYSCPQSLFKFHPAFDAALAGILRGDPSGRLVLIGGNRENWKDLLTKRFRAAMPDVADRIVFLPFLNERDFLNLLAVSDVVLDTFPFGGGNTSYEAFAVPVPVVTLLTEALPGRITYALYKKMDWMDCVAKDVDDYVRIALRLGTDRDWREAARNELKTRGEAIYEDAEVVRELERFLLETVSIAK